MINNFNRNKKTFILIHLYFNKNVLKIYMKISPYLEKKHIPQNDLSESEKNKFNLQI